MENLITSILKNGLISPIIVKETGKNEYKIMCGHRRIKALKTIEETLHPASIPKDGR